jgi:ribonuclease-3
MDENTRRKIEETLEYHFSNSDLLDKAFIHSSSVEDRKNSNERLEFFGDSVLGLVVCQKLFEQYPDYLEGDLTKIKSTLVSRKTCAEIIEELGLSEYLSVGKGMKRSNGIEASVSAGLLEAIIAAIYFDGGFGAAEKFIHKIFDDILEDTERRINMDNCKSILQQYVQQNFETTPNYQLLDEKGPDHDKCFEIQVVINGRYFESAWGVNKKSAEQKAARNALYELEVLKSEKDSD